MAGKPARSPLTKRTQQNLRHKTALKGAALLHGLIEFAEGRREMTSAQVKASEVVLKKILPDLQATAEIHEEGFETLTRDELEDRIKALTDKRPELAVLAGMGKIVKTIEPKEPDDQ